MSMRNKIVLSSEMEGCPFMEIAMLTMWEALIIVSYRNGRYPQAKIYVNGHRTVNTVHYKMWLQDFRGLQMLDDRMVAFCSPLRSLDALL